MKDIFQTLHRVLRDKECLRFQATRDGNNLKVVIQPLIGDKPDDIDEDHPDDTAQVRAALALPLSLNMTPEELDAQFGDRFTLYGEARAPLHDAFNVLMENLKEAGKTAKNMVSKVVKPASKPISPPKPTKDEKTAGDEDAPLDTEEKPTVAATNAPAAAATQGAIF